MAVTTYDRSIVIYDIRTSKQVKSIMLNNKSMALAWNPMEPMNFTVGNEDSNCYSFDLRKFDQIKMIHKDHILAVLDVDYSPTGREFVSGSFDKTIRIFPVKEGISRECYHSKRMQKVFSVLYTMDASCVVSGSDDTNIRFWKAEADAPTKLLNRRESDAINYRKKLVEKFKYTKEIKQIKNKKHLPKYILNRKNILQEKKEKEVRTVQNKIANSAKGSIEMTTERNRKIVKYND